VTDSRMCSSGACCEQPGYECGTHRVGNFRISVKTSFDSEPPKFGNTAGAFPVVLRIESAVQLIQGLSKSVREAAKRCVAETSTMAKPRAFRCARITSTMLSTL